MVSCASNPKCNKNDTLCNAEQKCTNKTALFLGAFGTRDGVNPAVQARQNCIEREIAASNLSSLQNTQNLLLDFSFQEGKIDYFLNKITSKESKNNTSSFKQTASLLKKQLQMQNITIKNILNSPHINDLDTHFLYKTKLRNKNYLGILDSF